MGRACLGSRETCLKHGVCRWVLPDSFHLEPELGKEAAQLGMPRNCPYHCPFAIAEWNKGYDSIISPASVSSAKRLLEKAKALFK